MNCFLKCTEIQQRAQQSRKISTEVLQRNSEQSSSIVQEDQRKGVHGRNRKEF